MNRETIDKYVERRMYSESMGRCMNPACKKELFSKNGDLIEKAHIVPYCKTADNTFENLVILCPNCHTGYDKNSAFAPDEIKRWKTIRQQELAQFFGDKYNNFEELKDKVFPLLFENKTIYENYYIQNNKDLWDKFEPIVLINNKKIKTLLTNNLNLFQRTKNEDYSNLALVYKYLQHIDEFENSRLDEEKNRCILFPQEINSIFGLEPIQDSLFALTENIEELVTKLNSQQKLRNVVLDIENPYVLIIKKSKLEYIYLKDTPRLRQMCYNNNCNKPYKVRFPSLNFALKYIKEHNINYKFLEYNNFRKILIKDIIIIFTYEYCLNKIALLKLCPDKNSIVVNLHNWNGESCISQEAYDFSKTLNVQILTMDEFYGYINGIKSNS